jgi:hypothetical protein
MESYNVYCSVIRSTNAVCSVVKRGLPIFNLLACVCELASYILE